MPAKSWLQQAYVSIEKHFHLKDMQTKNRYPYKLNYVTLAKIVIVKKEAASWESYCAKMKRCLSLAAKAGMSMHLISWCCITSKSFITRSCVCLETVILLPTWHKIRLLLPF